MIDMPLYLFGYTVVLGSRRCDPQARVLSDRQSPARQISSPPGPIHSTVSPRCRSNYRQFLVAFLLVVPAGGFIAGPLSHICILLPLQGGPCIDFGLDAKAKLFASSDPNGHQINEF
jgi:hypothetical protein